MKIYLDLLPEDRKSELHRNKVFRMTIWQEINFLFPLMLLAGVLFGINMLLELQREGVITENANVQSKGQYQELNTYENKFKATNEMSANISKLQNRHLRWSDELYRLSSLIPEGVSIENISTKNYKFMVVGMAKTRDDLLDMRDILNSDKCISDLNIPLSNMVQREDVDFQMDFSIKEECLRKNK